VPDITACPLCKRPSLTVYKDPLSAKSNWLRCGYCRFSGDTIELFQRISRSATLLEAIHMARKNGLCSASADKITPGNIQGYTETYPDFRGRVSDVWDKLSRGTVENPSPELIRYAQSKHLWHGWLTGPHRRLSRFMGGADRHKVDELFLANFNRRALPKRGFGVVLAAAYQDVPGRICGMTFMGVEEDLHVPLPPFKIESPEGGLAMLDSLDGVEKTVYAIPRLDFALQFHRLNFTNQEAPLKMVVYNDNTRDAWNAVNAERVIFWSDEIDWRLFKQAKRKDGWISDQPRLRVSKRNANIYTKDTSPEAMIGMLNVSAVPWARFLAGWLTDKQRSPADLQGTLSSLCLTDLEAQRVIDECPGKQRDDLKRLLDDTVIKGPESVYLNRQTIVVRPDGWYSTNKAGDSLVTDAIVRLSCEATDVGIGGVFWEGEIQYRDKRIAFAGEPFHEIDKDPRAWLQDKTARAGMGYPRFDKSWTKHFTNLVKSFSPEYRKTQVTDRLGLNDSGDILFPCFSMHDGNIMTQQKQAVLAGMPALALHPPVARVVTAPEPVTAARASWLAAAAAYVLCLTGKHKSPVYILEETLARSSILSFMDGAGMLSHTLAEWTTEGQQKLAYLTNRFNYPVHLRAPGNVFTKLLYASYSTSFVSTDRLIAASLCTQHDGIILRDAPLAAGEEMPPFDDVLWYLADLQKRKFKIDGGETMAALLKDMCWFLGNHLTQFDIAHRAVALGQIRVCQKAGDSLIELLALLCLSGKLGMEYVNLQPYLDQACPPSNSKKSVCMDPENGQVYLPRNTIIRSCDRAGIPRPDLQRAEKELFERKLLLPNPLSDGILIVSGPWEEAIKGCRRELNTGV
jgi:hypothetical protein